MSRAPLPQLVPPSACLACDVCCRFLEPTSLMAPFFSEVEQHQSGLQAACFCNGESGRGEHALLHRRAAKQGGYQCPGFGTGTNRCRIYERRPLDCRLYPYLLVFDPLGTRVVLVLDWICPYAFDRQQDPVVMDVGQQIAARLESDLLPDVVSATGMIGELEPGHLVVAELPRLTRALCRTELGLARLTVSAKGPLSPYFAAEPQQLSAYCFASLYMWKDFFHLYWKVVGGRLLVVAEDRGASFLFVPPLGSGSPEPALEEARRLLLRLNNGGPAARIENVGDSDLPPLLRLGWRVQSETVEFVGRRDAWATLAGNALRSQRAACNHFEKHTAATWRPFWPDDLPQVVELYRRWSAERRAKHTDPFFEAQMKNSFLAHLRALREAEALSLRAWVVEIEGQVAAYTFGTRLPAGKTFAVLGEVADLSVKGLAAFTFRQLCREVCDCECVNIMGDSGLPSLLEAKQQYHPVKAVRATTVTPG